MKIKFDLHRIKNATLDAVNMLLLPLSIGMIGLGLWMYRPWLSLVIIGAIILILALTVELRSK